MIRLFASALSVLTRPRLRLAAAFLLAASMGATTAWGQGNSGTTPGKPKFPGISIPSPSAATAAPTAEGDGATPYDDSRDHVRVSIVLPGDAFAPGTEVPAAIVMQIDPEWHIWANRRELPPEFAKFEYAINTEISVTSPEPSGVKAHVAAVQWPELHKARADVGEGPQDFAVFAGKAIAYLPITIDPNAAAGKASLTIRVSVQACNASTCQPAADIDQTVQFNIAPDAPAVKPLAGDPTFARFDASVFQRLKAGVISTAAPVQTRGADQESASNGETPPPSRTFFGIKLPSLSGGVGYLLLIMLSILGGLILNLTPCVLPIIPIKILTISQHAKTPGKSLYLGLWMAAGVVAFWAGIGVPAAIFTSAADPSRIFGIWWVTLGIGLLIGVMGVGIMGLFTIQLPAAVYSVNPKADSAWGSFLFGVMTAVLGLPCFGFVAGALLAGAAALPPVIIALVFTSIGVGMALPYLVLAMKPSLVDRVPRTGPASELVKQVMGLLLMAAGAYFAGSGLISLVIEEPYLGRELHWWVVAAFAALAGLWLMIRTFQITNRPGKRAAFAIVGLVIAGGSLLFAVDVTGKAKSEWEARQSVSQASDEVVAGAWNDYTPARFAKARAAGHIVVLDFTASWCLTCKVLKASVLDPDPVKTAFANTDVVVFTVDLTSRKDPGWDFLHSLGQTGIPTLAVYTPGKDEPWVANAYTSEQVIEALAAARANRVASR